MTCIAILNWSSLSAPSNVVRHCAARRSKSTPALQQRVREIIRDVRARGDAALLEFTRRFDGAALRALEVGTAEFAAAETALDAEQRRSARPRHRQRAALPRSADSATPLRVETSPGVVCERHYPRDRCRRPLRAGRRRSPALHRNHARGASANRRLSDANHLHAAAPGRHRGSGRADDRQPVRRANVCSSSAARRRLPRWRTARRACRRSTRSSVPATRGSTAAKLQVRERSGRRGARSARRDRRKFS